MSLDQSYNRVDTLELKALILQRIGLQRAEKYFENLRRLFSRKISKCEFNKQCVRTIGRENLSLHNHLIRSIVKNACLSKVPPEKNIRKTGPNSNNNNKAQKTLFQSLYGDSFPSSPRKARSPPASRERKLRDRPSPLGPFGKPQAQQSATELLSLGSRPSVEDSEEVEQSTGSPGVQSRSPVTAPFGVSMNNLGGSRKFLCNNNNHYNVSLGENLRPETCQSSGELPDTRSLRNRLKRKLEVEGFDVSVDCVNLLNNGLDAYLKRLVEPCVRLAGSRRGRYVKSRTKSTNVSLLDFRAAMELNPQILGEDWAIQLEKISSED